MICFEWPFIAGLVCGVLYFAFLCGVVEGWFKDRRTNN
jgi:hypothetical protein